MVSKYEHNVALFSSASNSLDEDTLRLHQGILIDEIKQIKHHITDNIDLVNK